MKCPFRTPPVGRRSTVSFGQAKTKTVLRRENQLTFAASACLPSVGPGALKLSERRFSSRYTPTFQAHSSMRICSVPAK